MAAKWQVCPVCRGEGTVDTYGAFTSADLDDWFGDTPERDGFLEDYTNGRIGRDRCGTCDGQRVVLAAEAEELFQDYQERLNEIRWGY